MVLIVFRKPIILVNYDSYSCLYNASMSDILNLFIVLYILRWLKLATLTLLFLYE